MAETKKTTPKRRGRPRKNQEDTLPKKVEPNTQNEEREVVGGDTENVALDQPLTQPKRVEKKYSETEISLILGSGSNAEKLALLASGQVVTVSLAQMEKSIDQVRAKNKKLADLKTENAVYRATVDTLAGMAATALEGYPYIKKYIPEEEEETFVQVIVSKVLPDIGLDVFKSYVGSKFPLLKNVIGGTKPIQQAIADSPLKQNIEGAVLPLLHLMQNAGFVKHIKQLIGVLQEEMSPSMTRLVEAMKDTGILEGEENIVEPENANNEQ